jgi:hypothetical protein
MTDDERRFSIPETASISGSSRRCCTVRAPHPEGFRKSIFQNFALGIKGLLGRWRDRDVFSSFGKNQAESLHWKRKLQPFSIAVVLPA